MPVKADTAKMFDAFSAELVFALDICEQAGRIALKYFDQGIAVDLKQDGSPVTVADRECERLIRQALATKFPQDAILGEEEGESPGVTAGKEQISRRKWIIDPIDGTYNFARGVPIFATFLALEDNGEIVLGVMNAVSMGEIFWAERGRGAFRNGRRISVSKRSELGDAQFNFGCPSRIMAAGLWEKFGRLITETGRQRGFGDYLGFAHVFEGKAEAHLEVGVKPWDLAPAKIIIEEAGGKYSDLNGQSSIYQGGCLVSNGLVHDQCLKILLSG